jgi:hypothetical protein
MPFFKLFTPVSYWLLVALWTFILFFYIQRISKRTLESKLFVTLLIILSIDAFRTLFESLYFGMWYTSLVGFFPKSIHDFLIRPENVFLPKALNVIAAILIIVIVLRRWIPEETAERQKEAAHLKRLENEIAQRKAAEAEKEKTIIKLQTALNEINSLRGILPLCSFCKKIRNDSGYWEQVDVYIHKHSQADISHSICPECRQKHYPSLDDL